MSDATSSPRNHKPQVKARVSNWRVARLLALRQIQRSSIWMNVLIVVIMTLTFLNLVVITGILKGLTEALFIDNRVQYTGDVFISPLSGEPIIDNKNEILETLNAHEGVERLSTRYLQQATVEANYQSRWDFNEPENSVSVELLGISPAREDQVTTLSENLIEGSYLSDDETGYILLGTNNLAQYSTFSDTFDPLENIEIGSRVKISYVAGASVENSAAAGSGRDVLQTGSTDVDRSGVSEEFIVKGIVDSKVDQVSGRAYITKGDWQRLVNPPFERISEIAVVINGQTTDAQLVADLKNYGLDSYAEIETAEEALPSVLNDLQATFGLLGNIIGGIAVVVSAITVFVVIYINALTRRKHIGILKGIGIDGAAIKKAYVLQSLFYAAIGGAIGSCIIFFFLVPYFEQNPIDFPFSDGILAVDAMGTFIRAILLIIVTAIAGFIPSWLIVRQNTLDSILGR